jgi:hypothetical protein
MERQPSIHISKGALYKVLKRVMPDDYADKELKALCTAILKEGVKHSLANRTINVTNQKLQKATRGMQDTQTDDVNKFAHILTLCRRKLHHKGIVQPAPGSKDWTIIQGLIANVNSFTEDFNLTRSKGYLVYIESGLKRMNNFYITNFQSLHTSIVNDYGAIKELEEDMTPIRTQTAHEVYSRLCGELAIIRNYSKDPSKMLCFKKAADIAAGLKVSIENYIKAQFEGLKWANTIPEPSQLINEGAITRLNKYIVKAGLKNGMDESNAQDVAAKIKQQWSKLL